MEQKRQVEDPKKFTSTELVTKNTNFWSAL